MTAGVRTRFCAWLCHRRHDLLTTEDDVLRTSLLTVLGLDDASLHAFRKSQEIVMTLPHASPNVFFPRVYSGWYARHLQMRNPSLFHLRVVLTHTNFSDLNWRPYAWWYVDTAGRLGRLTLFTRNKKRKHVVVASQGPVTGDAPYLRDGDRKVLAHARHAANRAYSYMLMSAQTERDAGLTVGGRTMYVPLDVLIDFARDCRDGPDSPARLWVEALFRGAIIRRVACSGELQDADEGALFVLDNSSNLAMLSLLGDTSVVGGVVMASYWDTVTARVGDVNRRSGVILPTPELVRRPVVEKARAAAVVPSRALAESLDACGISYSQGMAVAEHGGFARAVDPFA